MIKHKIAMCRSCGANIFWATTDRGKAAPINLEPVEGGNIAVEERAGVVHAIALVGTKGAALKAERLALGEPLYTSHFVTCPNADAHRKRQKPILPEHNISDAGAPGLHDHAHD